MSDHKIHAHFQHNISYILAYIHSHHSQITSYWYTPPPFKHPPTWGDSPWDLTVSS